MGIDQIKKASEENIGYYFRSYMPKQLVLREAHEHLVYKLLTNIRVTFDDMDEDYNKQADRVVISPILKY